MGSLAADFVWTAEDDFKLKSAAQLGTSMESLAKGAMQFSRRFTAQELHDRWLALLYDPVVAAEASTRMLEFEYYALAEILKSDHLDNTEENILVSGKRKTESVRRCFYAMRKRMRIHPLNSLDRSFHNATVNVNGIGNEEHPSYEDAGHADINLDVNQHMSHREHRIRVEEYNCIDNDALAEESDEFKEIYDLLEDEGTDLPCIINQPHIDNLDEYPISEGDQAFHLPDTDCEAAIPNQMLSDTITADNSANNYLMEISNTLFDLAMEDELSLMDAEGNALDKSYIDGFSSVLLDSPNKDARCDTDMSTMPFAAEFCHGQFGNKIEPQSGQQETSTDLKLLNSVIICTLNTEDPDVPSNDDVFLLPLAPFTSPYEMHPDMFKLPPHPTSKSIRDSTVDRRRDFKVPKPIIPKENRYEHSQLSSSITRIQFQPVILGDHRIKQEISSYDDQPVVHGKLSMPCEDRSQACSAIISKSKLFPASENAVTTKSEPEYHHCSSVSTVIDNMKGGSDNFTKSPQSKANVGDIDMNGMASIQQEETSHAEVVSTEVTSPVLVVRQSPMEEVFSSSDDDLPSFSDVEEMIVDEEAEVDKKNLHLNGIESSYYLQTLKYEDPDTRKRIIRWEQAADAFVKREMTARGAFAILLGGRMKFYVKKPEVLIGRATEDVNVDIDLGRQGRNSRVSRRQAILRMDKEGFFLIKNLGKYSIFVNNAELSTNQSTSLTSSCLIEIRGMSFLFETNEARIQQHIDSLKNQTDMEEKFRV